MSLKTPNADLFYIYDSHCPWSYASAVLVEKVLSAFPTITLRAMHVGYYDGDNKVSPLTLTAVGEFSKVKFGANYVDTLNYPKDSTLVANLMAWVQNKSAKSAFELLTKLQHAHFVLGNELTDKESVIDIIDELKLSPPAKCLQSNKLTKDAEFAIHDIIEIQEIIGTQAIPALLLACNESLVLLNHNLYLENPDAIVDAVKLELENLS
jgi:protein-disulfide isomerase-like protein with CxxC motif